jgi:hypothetical protein
VWKCSDTRIISKKYNGTEYVAEAMVAIGIIKNLVEKGIESGIRVQGDLELSLRIIIFVIYEFDDSGGVVENTYPLMLRRGAEGLDTANLAVLVMSEISNFRYDRLLRQYHCRGKNCPR